MEFLENLIPAGGVSFGEIAQMEDHPVIGDGLVPTPDEFPVHLLGILERSPAEVDQRRVPEMGVGGEEDSGGVEGLYELDPITLGRDKILLSDYRLLPIVVDDVVQRTLDLSDAKVACPEIRRFILHSAVGLFSQFLDAANEDRVMARNDDFPCRCTEFPSVAVVLHPGHCLP